MTECGRGLGGLFVEMLVRDVKLLAICRRFRPDVLTAISGAFAAQAGWLARRPVIVWDDTEHQKFAHLVTYPFATAVFSPDCYRKRFGPKHHLYPGCHELAYLHPRRFTADAAVARAAGVDPDGRYCLIRLISWGAHHDVGQHGIDVDKRVSFVRRIARHARPYITAEGPLPAELEPYRLRIPVSRIHHVLAFALLYVGEGATMASEAALLGTPAVYTNTLGAGTIDMFSRYGLVWQVTDTDEALDRSEALLTDSAAKRRAQEARQRVLADKIDVTRLIVETLEDQGGSRRRGLR